MSVLQRWLTARRTRRAERALAALPFRQGAGMTRRLAYAHRQGEPLYLTRFEMEMLRRVIRSGAHYDPLQFGIVAEFTGYRIVVDRDEAEEQERASRSLADHGGYPMGILTRDLIETINRRR